MVLRNPHIELQDEFYRAGNAVAINRFGQGPDDVAELIDRPVGAASKAEVFQGDQDVVEIVVLTASLLEFDTLGELEKKTGFGAYRDISGIPQGFRELLGAGVIGSGFLGGSFVRSPNIAFRWLKVFH